MLIINIIIILLLCRIIMNQQMIDYHISEASQKHAIQYDEIIERRGIINMILRIIDAILFNIKYSLKKKFKSNK